MPPKAKTAQFDSTRVCGNVDCKKAPMVGSDFCSGVCVAKTVDEYEEIAGDLFQFPGANISPEYQENFRVNLPTK